MKVLHLLKTSVGATWALRQITELINIGVEVIVAFPDGPLVGKYRDAGAKIVLEQFDFVVKNPLLTWKRCKRLREIVDHHKPDIIQSHFVGTTLTMRLALRKYRHIPRIFMVPGPLHLEHFLFRRIELGFSQANDYWIASCEWTRECYIKNRVSPDKVGLSYYGGYPEEFSLQGNGVLYNELGLDKSVKIVGMVAFMYAPKRYLFQKRGLKGHEDLMEAIAICRQKNTSIHGVFVGGSWGNKAKWYEEQLKNYAKKICPEGIHLLGNRSDVPAIYPDFDVVVHPSHSENLGGSVESSLAKIPTIATNIGGFPDVIKHLNTGLLVEPESPEELATQILYMLEHYEEAQVMVKNANELVIELCDVCNNAKTIASYYNSIIDKGAIHV